MRAGLKHLGATRSGAAAEAPANAAAPRPEGLGARWDAARLMRLGAMIFAGLFLYRIAQSTYLPINGEQTWRQADVYSTMMGMLGLKDMPLFARFGRPPAVFDMPLYQTLTAAWSALSGEELLVAARRLNALVGLAFVLVCWRLCARLTMLQDPSLAARPPRRRAAQVEACRLLFFFLAANAPAFRHYFATPLPDTLGVTLSLFGVGLWLSGRGATAKILCGAALALAAFMKSPIAFVFLVFLGMQRLMGLILPDRPAAPEAAVFAAGPSETGASEPGGPSSRLRFRLGEHWDLIALGLVCLILALGAEAVRGVLMDTSNLGLVDGANWYFGSLQQRLSLEFWMQIGGRMRLLTPLIGAPIYLLAVILTFRACGRAAVRLHVAIWVACLIPWLIFANLYYLHSYYQLPIYALAALSFAAVLQAELTSLSAGASASARRQMAAAGLAVLALLTVAQEVTRAPIDKPAETPLVTVFFRPDELEEPRRLSFYTMAEHLLRDTDRVLVVSDIDTPDPSIGARLSTPFERISHAELEAACDAWLADWPAVVTLERTNPCLEDHRGAARTYVVDEIPHGPVAGPAVLWLK